MVERESQRRSPQRDDEGADTDVAAADATTTTHDDALDEDVDAILDEIDEVLETNAAEFVQGFVQKGGQ